MKQKTVEMLVRLMIELLTKLIEEMMKRETEIAQKEEIFASDIEFAQKVRSSYNGCTDTEILKNIC